MSFCSLVFFFNIFYFIFFFFFQAEDGIRDLTVTEFRRVLFRSSVEGIDTQAEALAWMNSITIKDGDPRSEERREGKSVDLGGRRIIKKKKKKKKKKIKI